MYERFGFRLEGHQRGAMLMDGVYSDCYTMALRKEHALT